MQTLIDVCLQIIRQLQTPAFSSRHAAHSSEASAPAPSALILVQQQVRDALRHPEPAARLRTDQRSLHKLHLRQHGCITQAPPAVGMDGRRIWNNLRNHIRHGDPVSQHMAHDLVARERAPKRSLHTRFPAREFRKHGKWG